CNAIHGGVMDSSRALGAPSLVFVLDTTGSMFEEITAARLRAHSIMSQRAFSPQQPGTFILVPFHDPEIQSALNYVNHSLCTFGVNHKQLWKETQNISFSKGVVSFEQRVMTLVGVE
uniref:von Willebrand factor A domain containing 7 n=1 Tax=Neogobius melanostomus TaxID=47308 RepID=A0A8C6U3J8_9GOBI